MFNNPSAGITSFSSSSPSPGPGTTGVGGTITSKNEQSEIINVPPAIAVFAAVSPKIISNNALSATLVAVTSILFSPTTNSTTVPQTVIAPAVSATIFIEITLDSPTATVASSKNIWNPNAQNPSIKYEIDNVPLL